MQENRDPRDVFRDALLNDQETARRMIEEGININGTVGQTYLQFSIRRGSLQAVRFLLENGVTQTWKSIYSTIFKSSKTTQVHDILKLILEEWTNRGADYNLIRYHADATTLLHALQFASLACIKLLLEHGADITALDRRGNTALHYAARNPQEDVIRFILDLGFDIDLGNYNGCSALYQAVSSRNVEACELLLKHGADANKGDLHGETPLIKAIVDAVGASAKIVQMLLEYGADVTVEITGRSPLKYAILFYCAKDVVKLLLQHISKMVYLNLGINESDRKLIAKDARYRGYYDQCLQELRDMETMKFYDDVSVFDICMSSRKVISRHAKKKELVEALPRALRDQARKKNYKHGFPRYFTSSLLKFYNEVEKQRLRRGAAKILSDLFKFNDPFHLVNQKILSYLKDEDLTYSRIRAYQ